MVSGTGASAGIGIGRVVILKEETLEIKRETIADAEAEKARFKKAVEEHRGYESPGRRHGAEDWREGSRDFKRSFNAPSGSDDDDGDRGKD